MPSYFEKRFNTPVETRSYATYYIAFSALLFLGTLWSVWDEVKTRRPWKDYQVEYYELLSAKYDSLRAEAVAELDSTEASDLAAAVEEARKGLESEAYTTALDKKMELQEELDIATREWRFARSRSDAAYYQWKRELSEGGAGVESREELDEHEADIEKWFQERTQLEQQIAELDVTLDEVRDEIARAEVELNELFTDVENYGTRAERALESPIAIRQVVQNDYEFTPFQEVKARVDRCQTCHAGWGEELMEGAPQPFAKHPFPELLEKHNPEVFGCTPCHWGQGTALTEGFAHGDADHYWETPILKGTDIYASCNACHYNETRLTYAEPFVNAKQVVIESGCYGCHEIKGFGDLPKIGPHLNSITAKTSPDWIYRWVKNPKDYTPHTRMPNFEFDDEQAEAVTAYLVSIGKDSEYGFARPAGTYRGGNASEGKQLFESVGCMACHVVGENTTVRDERGTSYDIAPELTRVGSKINPDWAFDWLKNPRHYNADSRMPSLRVTDTEARHLVSYLVTLKDERPLGDVDLTLDDQERIDRGAALIREYGCAGCHEIKGMEREGKVSVELSDFGRKKYEQMDFGDTKELPKDGPTEYEKYPDGTVGVQHTWAGWVYGKLKNSRQYRTERIPQKMPIYSFSDSEVELVRTFLKSMRRDVPLPAYQRAYDKRMQDIEAGRRVTMRYQCQQCHQLEGEGGYVVSLYEEAALGPPLIPETQGAKVQEPWLHAFFKDPSVIRPWLDIRMPTFQFSESEISALQKYFLGLAHQELSIRDYASYAPERSYLGPGKQLFDAYQCAKCHPSGPVAGEGVADLAPDLAMASARLKPEWIDKWLLDPQQLQPGTRMPTYFYDGVGPDGSVYDGDAHEQIKALSAYVWSIGKRSGRPLASGR